MRIGRFGQRKGSSRLGRFGSPGGRIIVVLGALVSRMLLGIGDIPPSPPRQWVVILEAAAVASAVLIDSSATETMLRALGDGSTVALHSPDRIALQLNIVESDVEKAFYAAIQRWRRATQPVLPRGWSLVRCEIVTREELDRASTRQP
jgi:hypothetical protein